MFRQSSKGDLHSDGGVLGVPNEAVEKEIFFSSSQPYILLRQCKGMALRWLEKPRPPLELVSVLTTSPYAESTI